MWAESAPDNPEWLRSLVGRTPLLPDASLRRHWQNVIPWLPAALRYELAGILMDIELACRSG